MSLHTILTTSAEKLKGLRGIVPLAAHKTRVEEIDRLMELGNIWDDPRKAGELGKERQKLSDMISALDNWDKGVADDLEFREMLGLEVEAELLVGAEKRLKDIESFELLLLMNGEHDRCDTLLTIVSGAGGLEAKNWCQMLLRMYCRYCDSAGYTIELLDEKVSDENSSMCLDAATIRISGGDGLSYGWFRNENGIFRLIRQSPFSSTGQRHTSFAAVSVLPDIEDDIDIKINENDIECTAQTRGGPGGQNSNRIKSCVRLKYLPLDINILVSNERDFHSNKRTAMKMLKAKLYDIEVQKKNAEKNKLFDNQSVVAFSSQIRTWTLTPFQLCKDHRSEWETNQAQAVLDGDIKEMLEASLRNSI